MRELAATVDSADVRPIDATLRVDPEQVEE
jgi:hypothetical protein